MRVLFVSSGNSSQGIGAVVANQAESLSRIGVYISIYTITGKGIVGYLSNVKKLRRVIMEDDFSIIHAHYGFCGIVSLLAKGKEPLVVSFMGDDVLGSRSENGSIKFKSKLIAFINKTIGNLFYDHIIVKTTDMASGLNINKMTVQPNGVDINNYYPKNTIESRAQLGIDIHKPLAIFVSNPARPEKNYKLAYDAINLAISKGINIDLVPLWGRSIADLNLYYNAADFLLLTSFHEGGVNVIKEAMATNCPIISTAVGDVELVFGDTPGCYICEYDSEEIYQRIDTIIKQNIRTNGRERIISLKLDSDSVANRIVNIYNSLLQ